MKRVGILGGGQLGLLLGAALRNLGARPRFYDPDPEAPAARHFPDTVTAAWTDEPALEQFVASVDTLTYEFENVNTQALRAIASRRTVPLRPRLAVLEETQHRIREKEFLRRAGLPHVAFRAAGSMVELQRAARELGFPAIVKSASGGYDGKGQYLAGSEAELREPTGEVVVEEPIALTTEVSCLVARSPSRDEESLFPVIENLHRDHILDRSLVPARIAPALAEEVRRHALTAARALDVEGLLAVEFFVGKRRGGTAVELFVNELAPRPHNSGHITLAACTYSQFDALARILVGAPLGNPGARPGAYCMGNLLGDIWLAQGNSELLDLTAWADAPEVADVTLYGKRGARAKRKMGHFIAAAETTERALDAASRFRTALAAPKC